mgnify:CR=1 FL=1
MNFSIKERWTERSSSQELEIPLSLVPIHPGVTTTNIGKGEEELLKAVSSTQEWLDQPDMPLAMELSLKKAKRSKCSKLLKRKRTQD